MLKVVKNCHGRTRSFLRNAKLTMTVNDDNLELWQATSMNMTFKGVECWFKIMWRIEI